MLVSIVIPLYNKGFIINKTINSVLKQTYTNFEIIIINDGSTDNSNNVVSRFTDNRIKIYNQENKGASVARNCGIEKSSGELIAFLDADDYWHTNHLEELVKLYQDYPDCGMYCSRYSIKISNFKTISTSYKPSINNSFRGVIPDYFEGSLRFRIGLTSALAIPKYLLKDNYLFNPNISTCQDLELFTKIAIAYKTALTNKVTVEYNFSIDGQLSKVPIYNQYLLDFEQFNSEEIKNKSLNKFLDIYRLEFGLKFRIFGDIEKSTLYIDEIKTKIPVKTQVLLITPPFILRRILSLKHWLQKKGIYFSIYQ